MPRYWLMKSEPEAFSIDDLARAKNGTTRWDGVRNYQARNFLRDDISLGDGVLFYHSSVDPPAVVGTARVARAGYPDPTQFDPQDGHCDPDSPRDAPRWFAVDLHWLPSGGYVPLSQDPTKWFTSLILPWLVLAAGSNGQTVLPFAGLSGSHQPRPS